MGLLLVANGGWIWDFHQRRGAKYLGMWCTSMLMRFHFFVVDNFLVNVLSAGWNNIGSNVNYRWDVAIFC